MIVAFGTSTPTSITVVATSTSISPAVKAAHDGAALGGLQPAVHAADAESLQLRAPQPLRLVLGGTRDGRLGGLDQRADDVGLAAVAEVAREPLVRLGAAVVGDPRGHDRLSVRRRRRDLRHLRGRRRRSARACAGSASPSCGGRAGCAPRRARRAARRRSGAARRRRRRRGRGSRRPSGSARACRPRSATSPEAISCRTFACSFAPSALVRSATRTPSSVQMPSTVRKCCSARTSVGAISAPCRPASTARSSVASATTVFPEPTSPCSSRCIGVVLREVAVDLGDRLLLGLGEREREHLAVALQQLAGRRQRLGDERLPLGRAARERELEDEELVEGEPPPPLLRLLRRARPVQRDERVGAQRQPLGRRRARRAAHRPPRGRARAPRRRGRGAASGRAPRWPGRRGRSRPSRSPRRGRSSRPGSRSG